VLGVSEKQSILEAMEHLLAKYLEIRPCLGFRGEGGGVRREAQKKKW
jgi:hypothetical protein